MPAQLALYEEIRTLSSHMADAARSNDWQRLTDLERRVAALRDEIIAADAGSGPDAVSSALETDRNVEPWMADVRQFLGAQSGRRQVQQAYAAADSAADGLRI